MEVYPEDIDDLTLYDKYAVKANNNKSNDDNMNKVENERSSSFHAELWTMTALNKIENYEEENSVTISVIIIILGIKKK